MNEKILDWFAEKYCIEDIINRNIISIYSSILFLILYTSQSNGEYLSSLLNLFHARPLDFINHKNKLYNLTFSIYTISLIAGYIIPKFMYAISKKYFHFFCSLEKTKQTITQILTPDPSIKIEGSEIEFARKIQSIAKELEERRNKAKNIVSYYLITSTTGMTLIVSSYFGNLLDFLVGIILTIFSFVFLYKSVGCFVSKVVPYYAIYNQYSKGLDYILKRQ